MTYLTYADQIREHLTFLQNHGIDATELKVDVGFVRCRAIGEIRGRGELGVTVSCLSQRLRKYKEHGLERVMDISWAPVKKQVYETDKYEAKVIDLYQQGHSFAEITEKIGCSSTASKRFLRKNGIPARKAVCRSAFKITENIDSIRERLSNGETVKRISESFGVREATIRYHLSKPRC